MTENGVLELNSHDTELLAAAIRRELATSSPHR
jgi:hypothetical protein